MQLLKNARGLPCLHALHIHVLAHAAEALPHELELVVQGELPVHDAAQVGLRPQQGPPGAEVLRSPHHLPSQPQPRCLSACNLAGWMSTAVKETHATTKSFTIPSQKLSYAFSKSRIDVQQSYSMLLQRQDAESDPSFE